MKSLKLANGMTPEEYQAERRYGMRVMRSSTKQFWAALHRRCSKCNGSGVTFVPSRYDWLDVVICSDCKGEGYL